MKPYYTKDGITLFHGDCREVLAGLPDNSVDSIVTDPPYGLKFMGKKWDCDVPAVEIWQECLRVLKPGGHLLAFAGTRTQHRMACRIEDAGFEIRDMIAWVYGSGFPKSLDIGKAIDRAAGVDREILEERPAFGLGGKGTFQGHAEGATFKKDAGPVTEAARQWNGWGTAIKPALETVTWASKPLPLSQVLDTMQLSLWKLEVQLWLLSSASTAAEHSASSQSEFDAALDFVQWSAADCANTLAALSEATGMLPCELAILSSLNTVSSWRRTLADLLRQEKMSTTETGSEQTTDWKTLNFCLSQITPGCIVEALSLPGGSIASASLAVQHFGASLALLQAIRTLSATAPAMSQDQANCQAGAVKPSLDPCIMARKPLSGTVAANVLKYGTGGLNIDGCRVGTDGGGTCCTNRDANGRCMGHQNAGQSTSGETFHGPDTQGGRFPANLIHDGSDEVVGLMPDSKGQQGDVRGTEPSHSGQGACFGQYGRIPAAARSEAPGSAARFFYQAKADKQDRDAGCGHLPRKTAADCVERDPDTEGMESPRAGAGRTTGSRNHHATVKPTDLMRYLCRLVTPPGGVCLDPFMGSGSTGRGAVLERFQFIGIEREAEYLPIAEARIRNAAAQKALPLDAKPKPTLTPGTAGPGLFDGGSHA